MSNGLRLNKFISDSGFCSRREADAYIAQGAVTVNGQVAGLGVRVTPGDSVKVGWQRIRNAAVDKTDRVYIAYHKPPGITCTTDRSVPGNIIDAVRHRQRVYPVGRLDNQSEGLIFLTSDGDIVNKILRVGNAHEKEYIVTVDKAINAEFVARMAAGIPILGTLTRPCKVVALAPCQFRIVLTQGLNRQIRRMCEYLGYTVLRLKRVRIMSVKLGTLKPGQWRDLSSREMAEIQRAIAGSDSNAVASVARKASRPRTVVAKSVGAVDGNRALRKPGKAGAGRGVAAKAPAKAPGRGGKAKRGVSAASTSAPRAAGRRKPGRRK